MLGGMRADKCMLGVLGGPGIYFDNTDGVYQADGGQGERLRQIQYYTIGAAQEEEKKRLLR